MVRRRISPRVTISSLPPELIYQIVNEVNSAAALLTSGDGILPSMRANGAGDDDDDAADENRDRVQNLMQAFTNAMMGGLPTNNGAAAPVDGNGAASAAPAAATNANTNNASRTTSNAGSNPPLAFDTSAAFFPWPRNNDDAASDTSDESMPALEPVNREAQDQGSMSATAVPSSTGAAPTTESLSHDNDEHLTDGGNDSWEDGSEADFDSEGYLDSDDDFMMYDDCPGWESQRIYPDGLPDDPLLPLLFVSRPFLNAARMRLWRNVSISSAHHASLVRRSLESPKHAAWEPSDNDSMPSCRGKNHLGEYVRTVRFSALGDVSLGRGGGQIYLDILKRCTRIEQLYMKPTFLRSARQIFFDTIEQLSHLRIVDIGSSHDLEKGCLITVPRVATLLSNEWNALTELNIESLSGIGGPTWEHEDMLEEAEACCDIHAIYSPEFGKRRKGLSTVYLSHPNINSTDLCLILGGSSRTLKDFGIAHWTEGLTRLGLATNLMTFGVHITHLNLDSPTDWDLADLAKGKVNFPIKRKGYKPYKPDTVDVNPVARYPYFLDALVPYLPHLETVNWSGSLASTTVFSVFPSSLKSVCWSHCTAVKPGHLAKLLRKQVDRVKTVTQPDGTKVKTTVKTRVSKGLECMTVLHDDLMWKDEDLAALEAAAADRNACLHLSGGASSLFNPLFNPLFHGMFNGRAGPGADNAADGGHGATGPNESNERAAPGVRNGVGAGAQPGHDGQRPTGAGGPGAPGAARATAGGTRAAVSAATGIARTQATQGPVTASTATDRNSAPRAAGNQQGRGTTPSRTHSASNASTSGSAEPGPAAGTGTTASTRPARPATRQSAHSARAGAEGGTAQPGTASINPLGLPLQSSFATTPPPF